MGNVYFWSNRESVSIPPLQAGLKVSQSFLIAWEHEVNLDDISNLAVSFSLVNFYLYFFNTILSKYTCMSNIMCYMQNIIQC